MKLAALTLLATAASTEAFGSFGGNKKAAPAPVAKVSQSCPPAPAVLSLPEHFDGRLLIQRVVAGADAALN